MHESEIAAFLKSEIEPVQLPAELGGLKIYPCSAKLSDGLFLPCLAAVNKSEALELIRARIDCARSQEKRSELMGYKGPGPLIGYPDLLNLILTKINRVAAKDIASIEPSIFAIPEALRKQIKLETSLGWARFRGVMKDGSQYEFGTEWITGFFQMPEGYSASDISQVIPVLEESEQHPDCHLFRERPFFECHVDGL